MTKCEKCNNIRDHDTKQSFDKDEYNLQLPSVEGKVEIGDELIKTEI